MNIPLRRQQILDEMASITRMERGKLSPFSRGPGAPTYFKLQCWTDQKNCTRYVPAHEVDWVRSALAGHDRFQALAAEFVDLTVSATHQESKKNSRRSKPNATGKPKPSSDSSRSD